MDQISVFAPIFKSQEQDDGSLMIYGKATGSDLDLDQQRCDPDWLMRAMPKWYGTGVIGEVGGNIREQHDSKRAVGKAIGHEVKTDGHYIKAHIVDPIAITKTKAGVFTGLSIGISRPRLDKEWIRAGDICEVSLCDRPALPTATFTMCKAAKPGMELDAADFDEERGLVKCAELTVDKDLVAAAVSDGTMTLNKARVALDLPEYNLDGGDTTKAVKPSPLNMPGAKKAVTTEAEAQAVADELLTVVKTTDVDHLDAPAPGQKCADCGDDGHLNCAPVADPAPLTAQQVDAAIAKLRAELTSKTADTEVKPEFDRDAAVALVKTTLATKAADDLTGAHSADEASDISNAQSAIGMIAALISSEASELAGQPSELIDISLLLDAVSSLQAFIRREQSEQTDITPDVMSGSDMVCLTADADVVKVSVEKAKYSAEQLRQMLKDGKAFKNADGEPSFPIGDEEDLDNAIAAVGRSKADHNEVRKYITGCAKAMGKSSKIPDNWASNGSNKAVDTEAEADETAPKTVEPEAAKATDVSTDPDALVKALTGVLEKADNPLRKMFTEIVEAATETTAKSVSDLMERLVKVESMATPGGPALRRTDTEVKKSRQNDLLLQAEIEKRKADAADDYDLKLGYERMEKSLRAQARALAA